MNANWWTWIVEQPLAPGCDEIELTLRHFQFERSYFGDEFRFVPLYQNELS